MATNYMQDGKVIQWTNGGSAVSSGDVVVIGGLIGVALVDIANGGTGSVQVDGVFNLPKVDAAVIAQGESLVYDVSASKFDDSAATPATGDVSGASAVAFEAKGATTDATIAVRLTGVAGTVA